MTQPQSVLQPSSASRALRLLLACSLLGAPTALLLPGCSGGSGGNFPGTPTVSQQLSGAVSLGNGQTGTLALNILSSGRAEGRLTVTTGPTFTTGNTVTKAITFSPGNYAVSGTRNAAGVYTLTGNIGGTPFSISATLPVGSVAGSFTVTLAGQTYGPATLAPVVSVNPTTAPTTGATAVPTTGATTAPTTAPTTGGTAAPTATTAPTTSGRVPTGTSNASSINLTSSNGSLSNGNLVASGNLAAVAVDSLGASDRITLTAASASLPPSQFTAQLTKAGGFFAGDQINIVGESGSTDLVTLLVANTSNPAASGTYRGRGGSFRITSVSGRTVNYTVANLRMESLTGGGTFTYSGSGSFTIR